MQKRESGRDDEYCRLALEEALKIPAPSEFMVIAHLRYGDCSIANSVEQIYHYTKALDFARTLEDNITLILKHKH